MFGRTIMLGITIGAVVPVTVKYVCQGKSQYFNACKAYPYV